MKENYNIENSSKKLYNFMTSLEKPLFYKNIPVINKFEGIFLHQVRNPEYFKNIFKNCKYYTVINDITKKVIRKPVLFINDNFKIDNLNRFNHYLNLFLSHKKKNFELLILNGTKIKTSHCEYLYLDIAYKINSISAFILNSKYIKKYISFLNGINSLSNSSNAYIFKKNIGTYFLKKNSIDWKL